MISIPCKRYETIKISKKYHKALSHKIFYRHFKTEEEAAKWIVENDSRFTGRRRVQAVIIPKEIENKILALYFHMIK